VGICFVGLVDGEYGRHQRHRIECRWVLQMRSMATSSPHPRLSRTARHRVLRREHSFVHSAAVQIAPKHDVQSMRSVDSWLESRRAFVEKTGGQTMRFIADRRPFHHDLAGHIGSVPSVLYLDRLRLPHEFAVRPFNVFLERAVGRNHVLLSSESLLFGGNRRCAQNGGTVRAL